MNEYNEKLFNIIEVCEFDNWTEATLYLEIGWKLLKVFTTYEEGVGETCWYSLGRPSSAPAKPQ